MYKTLTCEGQFSRISTNKRDDYIRFEIIDQLSYDVVVYVEFTEEQLGRILTAVRTNDIIVKLFPDHHFGDKMIMKNHFEKRNLNHEINRQLGYSEPGSLEIEEL